MAINSTLKTGILGGSFDPIHLGHTAIAQTARTAAGLDRLLFIPLCEPSHKSGVFASAQDRLAMTRLAIQSLVRADVSEIEINRGGTSYTVDTLAALTQACPDTRFSFIIGADTLLSLDTWKDFGAICALTDFICVTRPGFGAGSLEKTASKLKELYKTRIKIIAHAGVEVSSSEIKELIRRGESITGMVCPEVEQYIMDRGLYKE